MIDDFFLKAADFYRDAGSKKPSLVMGCTPSANSIKNGFRYVMMPNLQDATNFIRLDYFPDLDYSPDRAVTSYVSCFEATNYESIKIGLDGAIDALVTEYYHDKWMAKNAYKLTTWYRLKDWFKQFVKF